MNVFAHIGRVILALMHEIGRLCVFGVDAVTAFVRPPIYWPLVLKQMMRIGFFSLPVVGLTAFFTGGVLALQIYTGASRYGAEAFVPLVVLVGITRELGPVIAGLMVAGRVAAAIAAELGTMRVTEQIDALTTLATNPIKYLVAPRLPSPIQSAYSAATSLRRKAWGLPARSISRTQWMPLLSRMSLPVSSRQPHSASSSH